MSYLHLCVCPRALNTQNFTLLPGLLAHEKLRWQKMGSPGQMGGATYQQLVFSPLSQQINARKLYLFLCQKYQTLPAHRLCKMI